MASPLSVGDCIAIITVVIKGYNALSDTSEDSKARDSLEGDLQHMQSILEQLPKPGANETFISEANLDKLKDTVERCQATLSELVALTKVYGPHKFKIKTYFNRLAYAVSGKHKVGPIQARIQGLTGTLSLIQADITRQAIEYLKLDIKQRSENLSVQLRNDKEEVKLHIYTAIDEPWDQKPIRFQDALGRRFPVPLEICQRFEYFLDFLKFSFRTTHDVLPFVVRKDFWLFTPSVNGSPWWYLIHESDWTEAARPGARLGMSLFQADEIEWLPPGAYWCGFEDYSEEARRRKMKMWPLVSGPEQNSYIRFSRPVPPWSTLPQNQEFRWWSRPALSGPVSMTDSSIDQQRRNVMNSFAATELDEAPVWKVESQSPIYQPRYSGFLVVQNDVFVDSGTRRRYWRQMRQSSSDSQDMV